MEIQIININNKHVASLKKAIKLLNLSQSDFYLKLTESENQLENLKKEYSELNRLSNGKIDSIEAKEIIQKYFNKEDILYISIISEYLIGETYVNLFSEIITENGIPINYSFITDFNVEELLQGTPLEIYFIYTLLRYSIFYGSKQYIAHTETEINYCIFDYLVDKSHITNLLKTGNMCLDCQMKLDDSLSLNQILSINTILRIAGRISSSREPKKLFDDYLYLSESLNAERETNKTLLQDREIIEAVIAKISKITISENQIAESNLKKGDLKIQIAKGKLSQVFELLISYTNNEEMNEKYNEIILLQSRHYRLESEIRNGIISNENKETRQNILSKSMIDYIDTI